MQKSFPNSFNRKTLKFYATLIFLGVYALFVFLLVGALLVQKDASPFARVREPFADLLMASTFGILFLASGVYHLWKFSSQKSLTNLISSVTAMSVLVIFLGVEAGLFPGRYLVLATGLFLFALSLCLEMGSVIQKWEKLHPMAAHQILHQYANGVRDFRRTDLYGVVLHGADLRGADFSKANLQNADLREANLQGAIFKKTVMTGANLDHAQVTKEQLQDAVFSDAKKSNI